MPTDRKFTGHEADRRSSYDTGKNSLKFMMTADKNRTGYGAPGGRMRANMEGAEDVSNKVPRKEK